MGQLITNKQNLNYLVESVSLKAFCRIKTYKILTKQLKRPTVHKLFVKKFLVLVNSFQKRRQAMKDTAQKDGGPQGSKETEVTKKTESTQRGDKSLWSKLTNLVRTFISVGAIGGGITPASIGTILLLALLVTIAAVGITVIVLLVLAIIICLIAGLNTLIAIVIVFITAIVLLVVVFLVGVCAIVLGGIAGALCLPLIIIFFAWPAAPLWIWLITEVVWVILLVYVASVGELNKKLGVNLST